MIKKKMKRLLSALCAFLLAAITILNTGVTMVFADGVSNQSLPDMPASMNITSRSSGSSLVLHSYFGDNGVQVYCSEINVSFKPGVHTRQDLVGTVVEGTAITEDMVKRAALARDYYYSNGYTDPGVLTQQYVWYAFHNPDKTNYMGQLIATGDIGTVDAWINSVINNYVVDKAYAYVSGSSQVLSCFSVKPVPKGQLTLHKTSACPQITDNNDCYSLSGAEFGVYSDPNCTVQVATLVTDEGGNSNTIELDTGDYYVKEITAPKGYLMNTEIKGVTISSNQVSTVNFEDVPGNDPAAITLEKVDAETGEKSGQGAASLAGAEFTIKYYDGYYTKDSLPDEATRTWVIATKEVIYSDGSAHYICYPNDYYVVSEKSDDFYRLGNEVILPLGTIAVEETKAPEGYLLDNAYIQASGSNAKIEGVYVAQITKNGDAVKLDGGNEYSVSDQIIRGDLKFVKVADGTQNRLANVPFKITSATTGESHVIVTDKNGQASTAASWNKHTSNTNRGKTSEDGVWFGSSDPDDTKGALPYDDYMIEELSCDANKGMELLKFNVSIYKDSTTVNLGTLTDDMTKQISIYTTATDKATGGKSIVEAKEVTIVDTVTLENLKVGTKYQLVGWQMLKEANTELLINGERVQNDYTFTAKRENMKVSLTFTFDASKLGGNNLVTFEELYDLTNPDEPEKVAWHKDIEDEDQTVEIKERVISIHTSAADKATGDKKIVEAKEVTVADTITLKNLEVGTEYQLVGWQMLQEGNTELLIGDKRVENTYTFTADSEDMEISLDFTFNASKLGGNNLVTFEELYDLTDPDNPELAAEHKDITDTDQTVEIAEREITIHTKATDKETGNKAIVAGKKVTIVDTVTLKGLEVGSEYQLVGWQMLQEANTELLINGERVENTYTFTADSEDMEISLEFTFNASKLAGQDLVTFEELFDVTNPDEPEKAAEHKDITDTDQTILITERLIGIHTTATNQDTSGKELEVDKNQTIVDTVTLEGLEIGTTYRLVGWQMLKDNNAELTIDGKRVENDYTFTAEKENMEVQIEFTFHTSDLGGKALVTFEELYDVTNPDEPEKVAEHKDLNDKDQTVTVKKKTTTISSGGKGSTTITTSSKPKTGDKAPILLFTITGCASLALIVLIIVRRKKLFK